MNSLDGVDYDAINAAIARCGNGPYIEVVDRESPVPLHLIHFDQEGFPQRSPIVYAHRNGHGSMIVKLKTGAYRLCKYWKDPEEVNRFPTRFEREHAGDLWAMVSVGETETLQMLPRKVWNPGARMMSYREHLLTLHSERGSEAFRLSWTEEPNKPRVMSPQFTGKPWQSLEAVDWCHMMVPSKRADIDMARVNMTSATSIFGDLEDHPMGFMF